MTDAGMGNITREIIRRLKRGALQEMDLGGAASRYWEAASAGLKAGIARARASLRTRMIESEKPRNGSGVSCRRKYRARDLEPKRSWRKVFW